MDQIAEEDMTEVQLQSWREFQEKEKALAEEQDKYRKHLKAELSRMRSEVQELTQQFEVVLKKLHHQRFKADARFFCQEMYCVRLHLALLQNFEDKHVLKKSFEDLDAARLRLEAAEKELANFAKRVAEAREEQDKSIREEREVASAQHFRQLFAQSALEPELVTQLLAIFRRRRDVGRKTTAHEEELGAKAGQSRDPLAAVTDPFDAVAIGDPYPDLGTPGASVLTEALPDDDDTVDPMPEGVDEASFQRMLDARRKRHEAELEVQKGNAVLQEMSGLEAHYKRERDNAEAQYEQIQAELGEHQNLMDRELYDIELFFKLKQGQVEVPQAAVVTDYSDAIVIDNEVVESRNARILELGKDKISKLNDIKEFRKDMNLLEWEHRKLALQTTDLEERTKDFQMLRVTKGLQSLLKGGEEGRNKADADLLERKIEHLNSTTQQKEQALKKQFAMGAHAAKLRKAENGMLEKKLRELQQNVIQREHIRRLRAPQGSGAGTSGNKDGERPRVVGGGGRIAENEGAIKAAQSTFKEIRTRQQLQDAVKKHEEEMGLLRQELDRLRQKTFPSFVQLHQERAPNPDHSNRL